MMDPVVIGLVWAAMMAAGIWESSGEGRNTWAEGKHGWTIELPGFILTRYHFFLFWVCFPLLLTIPLVVDFSYELLRTILFAYSTGLIIQDFSWFIASPFWTIRDFGPAKVGWYPWISIGRFHVPLLYVLAAAFALTVALV